MFKKNQGFVWESYLPRNHRPGVESAYTKGIYRDCRIRIWLDRRSFPCAYYDGKHVRSLFSANQVLFHWSAQISGIGSGIWGERPPCHPLVPKRRSGGQTDRYPFQKFDAQQDRSVVIIIFFIVYRTFSISLPSIYRSPEGDTVEHAKSLTISRLCWIQSGSVPDWKFTILPEAGMRSNWLE